MTLKTSLSFELFIGAVVFIPFQQIQACHQNGEGHRKLMRPIEPTIHTFDFQYSHFSEYFRWYQRQLKKGASTRMQISILNAVKVSTRVYKAIK